MNQKIQLILVIAVAATGAAVWSMRQWSNADQLQRKSANVIIERQSPAPPSGDVTRRSNETTDRRPAGTRNEAAEVVDVTDATFSSLVLNSDRPVLVDFGADWCGACRLIEPVVQDLAEEFDGRMVVARVDVDANPNAAEAFGIEALPTLLVFKNGEVVEKIVGAASKEKLQFKLQQHIVADGTFL